MIELGKKQALMFVKKTDFGVYLGNSEEKVLLPKKYLNCELEEGDALDVFIYRDSKDRLIATTEEPLITLSQVRSLKVKEITKIGAFLDWGLEKDLLLPFKEQTGKVSEGKSYPVALYIDKSNRLCATMKIYQYLGTNHNYKVGDTVTGTAYEKIDKFGMFVAVDDMFQALIPNKALYGNVSVGDTIKATVSKVHEDGKIQLALREPAYLALDKDGEKILEVLRLNGGSIPFNDKSDPDAIKREFHMSKAAFKRACGHLWKEQKIQITPAGIILK